MKQLTFQESEAAYEAYLIEAQARRNAFRIAQKALRKARTKARDITRRQARINKLARVQVTI